MKLLRLIQKQGGIKLLKQFCKTGSLITAIGQLLLLGPKKKALEILRLSTEYKSKTKFEKKYREKLIYLSKIYDEAQMQKPSNVVWICWFQGIKEAPELVKVCYNSVKENLTNKDIILITEENMSNYVTFPDYIIEKWKKGMITHTHMTDLLRLELLTRYGGTWIDATVFCSQKIDTIPKYFFEDELFLYQTLKPGRDGMSLFISSWFISARPNNKILWITKELCYEYWKKNNDLIDYFLIHHFICMVLENNEDEWKKIVPRDNGTPHILLLRLFEEYDDKMWNAIRQQSPFHKLSYKFTEEQSKLKNTYYEKLILGELNE